MTLGNEDMLRASLVRWLLDAEAEHGLGTLFIHKLGAFLESVDLSELAFALQSDMLPVTVDVISRGATADLLVSLADSPRLSIVSVTTVQQESHVLAEYQAMEATPIAMTRLDETDAYTIPVWRWRDDVRAIQDKLPAGPFGDFVRQFAEYDPSAPDAAGTSLDLPAPPPPSQRPQFAPPPAPTPAPAPPPPPPQASPGDWSGGGSDTGGGLSDGWMDGGGGGGGLSDGWMGG
jgi:hypothetical protein